MSLMSFDFKQKCCEPQDLRHPHANILLGDFLPHIFSYPFSSCSLTLILQKASMSSNILLQDLGILQASTLYGHYFNYAGLRK